MQYQGPDQEYFEVTTIRTDNCDLLKSSRTSELSMLWFESDDNELIIDAVPEKFNTNDIVFLTEFHKLKIGRINQVKLLRFNRPFYCVTDHDSEVGCKGILYYGAASLPLIQPNPADLDILNTVWKMLEIEMVSIDNLQLEMLQMMLKRILILCTRIYKSQSDYIHLDRGNTDIIRDFNYLVEQHFRSRHRVSEYAVLMHKTPKSLANAFKKAGTWTPLEIIQNRRLLEARRLLKHTTETISEIGYELGFKDVQSFSRFFKNKEGHNPSDFRG